MEIPIQLDLDFDPSNPPKTDRPLARNWQEFINRLRYKPGYAFSITPLAGGGFPQYMLAIIAYVPDSTSPYHEEIPIQFKMLLPPWQGEHYAKTWLRKDAIRRMEDHEIDEWFRYDGELVNNPHANERS